MLTLPIDNACLANWHRANDEWVMETVCMAKAGNVVKYPVNLLAKNACKPNQYALTIEDKFYIL